MIANFIDVVINDHDVYRILFESDARANESVARKLDGLVARVSQRLGRTLSENSDLDDEDCDFLAQALVGLAISAARIVSTTECPDKQLRQQFLLFKLVWRGLENVDKPWE